MPSYKSPLHEMSQTTPTQFWNDNCSTKDIAFAMEHGAVGATSNPVLVGAVLGSELDSYIPLIKKTIADNPTATEDDITWMINEHMVSECAKLLRPIYDATEGRAGYISIQTNAKYYRDAAKTTEQATRFKDIAPNVMVKMPTTAAGIKAVEESTYNGVILNATVSFTVPQAIAVAEAIERGLKRREAEGKPTAHMFPVCTIMVGRVEDLLRDVAEKQGIVVDPQALCMSGVAVFKRAYKIYREKGYRTRLLAAATRHHLHWSELIGGDVSMTIPPMWIKRFANSDIEVKNRMDDEVCPKLLKQLDKFEDWKRAYEPDGMTAEEFASFGATRATLTQFLGGYDSTVGIIRKFMI
ncbi:MAG: transaldolase [Oscillospiraceae bacterium]|nr:transaldolase [Oscillospiraceae bacterium]